MLIRTLTKENKIIVWFMIRIFFLLIKSQYLSILKFNNIDIKDNDNNKFIRLGSRQTNYGQPLSLFLDDLKVNRIC